MKLFHYISNSKYWNVSRKDENFIGIFVVLLVANNYFMLNSDQVKVKRHMVNILAVAGCQQNQDQFAQVDFCHNCNEKAVQVESNIFVYIYLNVCTIKTYQYYEVMRTSYIFRTIIDIIFSSTILFRFQNYFLKHK